MVLIYILKYVGILFLIMDTICIMFDCGIMIIKFK
jgi:hypothetical protein